MYVLDTDIIIDFMKGKPGIVSTIESLHELYTTVTTLSELSYGFYSSQKSQKKMDDILEFMDSVKILGIGIPTSFKFGEIKAHLKSIGKLVDDFDILIASACIVHNCQLVTRNKKHFENIKGLKIYQI